MIRLKCSNTILRNAYLTSKKKYQEDLKRNLELENSLKEAKKENARLQQMCMLLMKQKEQEGGWNSGDVPPGPGSGVFPPPGLA